MAKKKMKLDMAPEQTMTPTFIQPITRTPEQPNILEEIYNSDPNDMPTLKAVGLAKVGNGWISYVMTTKGKEILSLEVSEPDMKGIAEESAKINFVETFIDKALI